jgi:SNF2 family DNA or RNA helicase
MVEFIKAKRKCALWVDMGLGKTAATLTAIRDLYDDFEVNRVLVIAPKRVALHTWPNEIQKWGHTQYFPYRVITGTAEQRAAILKRPYPVLDLINREMVPWLVEYWGEDWPYDMVVIDESSSFKAHNSKRFKALKKVLKKVNYMVELTGTPASNGLLDIWSQTFLIDQGERFGRSYHKFKQTYFDGDYMGYNWTIKPSAAEKIHGLLDDIVLTLSAEDYLSVPDRIDNTIKLDLNTIARALYKELEREFLLEMGDETVVAANAAVLSGKLLQAANGALYVDEHHNYEVMHSEKLDALDDLVEAANGQPILVAYNFKSDAVRIKERFPQAVLIGDDPQTIDKWNAGKIPVLLAHPASAGHGLNLQDGGNTIVWFGLNWSLELYAQFNARLHRQGQTKPVIVHHLVVENTIDETVLETLGGKHRTQKALLDALKSDIEGRE